MRASARSPQGFAIDQALNAADLLLRYGGHPAAGGFTVEPNNNALHERLNELATPWLQAKDEDVPCARRPVSDSSR